MSVGDVVASPAFYTPMVPIATTLLTLAGGVVLAVYARRNDRIEKDHERRGKDVGYEVQALQTQLKGWEDQATSMTNMIRVLSDQIKGMYDLVAAKDNKIRELELEIAQLRSRVRSLEVSNRSAESEY